MAALGFHGFFFFTRIRSLSDWTGEDGNSFFSAPASLEDLSNFANPLPRVALMDTGGVARFPLGVTSMYSFLKKACMDYGVYHSNYGG